MANTEENTKKYSKKMDKWQIKTLSKTPLKNFILIEGLPGMGNVGKIAIDFIIENTKADKLFDIYSFSYPHCVLVNEKNLIEMPKISIYHKKIKKNNFWFMEGDIQPLDEMSCYEFCNITLDLFQKYKGKEIITLGGIGQQQIPKNPRLFCTGTDKEIIKKYADPKLSNNIYGVVGPIVGVSGLLLGVSQQRSISALSILAETFGHPNYLGIKGAREMLSYLNKKFYLNLKLSKLDKEIVTIEKDIKIKTKNLTEISRPSKSKTKGETNYIG